MSLRPAKLPISPLAGEMPGRAEGGVQDRNVSVPSASEAKDRGCDHDRLTGWRDSTPLCPAGHLPRKGGDQQVLRRQLFTGVGN
ncbi:hypothetical protein FJV76_07795 [Mesorhizobium sp. WSM4303]|nr:hypothetical protein FJV77_12875 [Mesorhizobium sp. WSM4306]TRD06240.1 hypothetical protein FJV76_07795 [Mesorhizobium sp. WSM4303]